MAPRALPLLLLLLLLLPAVPPCRAQHWSHGWYPGGKRDPGPAPAPQCPAGGAGRSLTSRPARSPPAAMLRALRRCRPALGLGPPLGPVPGAVWGPRLVPARGRKTRHDPPAKSKASRLKVPPPVDPEELLVVKERYRQHRLVLGALRAEFRAEVLQKKREALLAQEDSAELREEHQRLMAWNQEENARQRARREERIRKEEEEQKRKKLRVAENKARVMEAFLKEKEQEILQLQEEAKTFITPENLEARIEECLDNPRNYNFAIDKDGRIVKRTVLS
ncbi:28S ribosomal protein S26, mitochondrial-like isoform X1 [Falco rusticolus]|uniref:28S ribosomal protein S26, mitochondrial-like isoform X1 n=2 Tax=Falco TaxID=8952 RepID=UPI001886A350|nr:28S ribosomal protein S26, mitochondrial-like isoform X1 [Falco rusticolus]